MTFKEIKEEIIMRDRKTAGEILESGGNVQEFYKNSETARTRFYIENGGAYCQLVAIIVLLPFFLTRQLQEQGRQQKPQKKSFDRDSR